MAKLKININFGDEVPEGELTGGPSQEWIDKNLFPPPKKVFMSHDKYEWAKKSSILIDDFTKNTIPWSEHDGIAILHNDENIGNTLARLEELGVETI